MYARRVQSGGPDVRLAGVAGAGTMGAGIALSFANAGIDVQLVDASLAVLERAGATIAANYNAQVERGRLTREAADERTRRVVRTQALEDLADVDVAIEAVFEDLTETPFTVTGLSDALVAAGRLGQKSGRGFYRYEPGDRKRHADSEVDALVAAERARLGVAGRAISAAEIVERCVYALVNEGAHVLLEGVAESAADIDMIWVNGYGFPQSARRTDALRARHRCRERARAHPPIRAERPCVLANIAHARTRAAKSGH